MITINYVSNTGELKGTKGELLNHKGYQFCLSKTNNCWMVHELTTGHLLIALPPIDNYILKANEARQKLKENLIDAFNKEGQYLENRIMSRIEINEGYGLPYPINQPID